ncbi:hypothetical protein Taro_020248 [Colocasia esculenta]|uniref:V-type proton ATPase subunit G n=1 Tax=Colocasia esculenta TaxID=4460 RepID=A0A843UN65_COLES|nr:hypothetical protein [Colocasia esculenta]
MRPLLPCAVWGPFAPPVNLLLRRRGGECSVSRGIAGLEEEKVDRRQGRTAISDQVDKSLESCFLLLCAIAMDSIRGQSSIQMLLTAEQDAQKILSGARKIKTERLRQAKEEADQEAAAYRSSLEREYQRKLAEGTGNSSSNVKRLEEETNHKIQELKDTAKSVSSEVDRYDKRGTLDTYNKASFLVIDNWFPVQ